MGPAQTNILFFKFPGLLEDLPAAVAGCCTKYEDKKTVIYCEVNFQFPATAPALLFQEPEIISSKQPNLF